jgi:NADH:ubiquinone oxidoreductase subunit F (NADH-binding)
MLLTDLYELQDRLGWLPEAELRALAECRSMPLARIHEIVSAYPLFRTGHPPPSVLVRVCRDPVCQLRGSDELFGSLIELVGGLSESQVEIEPAACLGQCDRCPAISINHQPFAGPESTAMRRLVRSAAAGERISRPRVDRAPLGWRIDPYRGQPGYQAIRRCVADGDPTAIIRELEAADLRGSSGLGAPVAAKWRAIRDASGADRVVIANAHGGEPGSVKDRELLRRAPHVVIEGMLLAAIATGATRGVFFVRHDDLDGLEALHAAIDFAMRSGFCGDNASTFGRPFPIELFISPGNFVSGEQTALLELLEGRRGEPRVTPPDPASRGLHGQPTLIHNVETLALLPLIVLRGGAWFREQGQRGRTGLRLVSIVGDVRHPGAFEVPAGLTFSELLDVAGGLPEGDELQAIAPAGPLGGFLAADNLLELPADPGVTEPSGARIGATFIVLNQRRNLGEFTRSCLDFFARESCGKCLPCRLGTRQLVDLFDAGRSALPSDEARQAATDLRETLQLTSLCDLGRWAATPFDVWVRHVGLRATDPVR